MTFCPRNYIIVHSHTDTQKLCLAPPPQQLVIKVGQTHLHAVIHVEDIQLPSSSGQIAPRSGSTRGSRRTQKHETQSRVPSSRDSGQVGEASGGKGKQLRNKRAECGGWGAICDYAESDVGGEELETLLARLSLQAASSAATCLFQIRFTDCGQIVLRVAKTDWTISHFLQNYFHVPILKIKVH